MQINIVNNGSSQLSLDVTIGEIILRETIAVGGSVDVGDRITIDNLNQDPAIRSLVAAGIITITTVSESTDVESLLDSQILQANQAVAASTTIFAGTADMSGQVQVELQAGAVPAAGESMVIDVLKNGITILSSAVTLDATTYPTVRETIVIVEANNIVAKGDEFTVSLTYTQGGGPTPIVNTSVRIKILKAA